MTGSGTPEAHLPGKYRAELAITWTIVVVPLAYGVYNAVKTAVQLFTG